jgi:hypothetical protein
MARFLKILLGILTTMLTVLFSMWLWMKIDFTQKFMNVARAA